jgi:CheY-like chemotaxis protein
MNTHKKILIVEDNPDIALALNEVLSDCGHDVVIAPNGKTGIDHLIHHPLPDVIILDMFLPVIGGREFKKRLEEVPAFAFIPVIGMSADIYGKKRCLSCGIEYFLQKPFELKELLEILDELSAKSGDIFTHFRIA